MSAFVSGIADYERVRSTIGGIVGELFSLILIGIGIYLLVERNNYVETTGTIKDVSCNTVQAKISCTLDINFVAQDQNTYTSTLIIQGTSGYKVGQQIQMVYDKRDPRDIYTTDQISLFLPIMFIVLGLVVIIGIIVFLYFSYKSRTFAAVTGGEMLINDAVRYFR